MTSLVPPIAVGAMLGLLLLARGLVPDKEDLRVVIDYFASSASAIETKVDNSALSSMEKWIFRLHGDTTEQFLADLAIVDRSARAHLLEVLKGAGGATAVTYFAFFMFGQRGLLFIVLAVIAGLLLGFALVERELSSKARKRRSEFDEGLTAVLSLIAVSMAGGSGLNTSIANTLRLGDGWVVEAIRRAVDEANFRNEAPWTVLGRLGTEFGVASLVELSATLSLVGTSGARVAETLLVRSASARSRLLSDQKSLAMAKSSAMGMPIGLMMVAWILFLTFSPVMSLLSS